MITAAGLALIGELLIVEGLRGGWQPDDENGGPDRLAAVVFVVAGLIANVLADRPLGFSSPRRSCSCWCPMASAAASRCAMRRLVSSSRVAAYFGFAKALGVNIGAGLFENLLGGLTMDILTQLWSASPSRSRR